MISINSKDELSLYHLEGKWNDYIGVQKEVVAVLKNEIMIDGELIDIRISIMKRIDSNWFWIHHIDEKEKVLNYSTHPKRRN